MKVEVKLKRGVIYVMRSVNGVETPLAICNQRCYAEWVGCFSAI